MTMKARAIQIAVATGGILLLSSTASLPAAPWSDLVVFGDSLSDVGNTYDATWWLFPQSPPHYQGRFSNGPVWVERLGWSLGLDASTASSSGGSNYAFGGAETGSGYSYLVIANVGKQVELYLSANVPSGDELFVLWAGGNDFLNGQSDPAVPLQNLASHITALATAGARTFLVCNLPPLGQTPRYRGTAEQAEIDRVVAEFNNGLAAVVASYDALPFLKLLRLDVAVLFGALLAAPESFGLTNVTAPAYDEATGMVVPNPEEYLFWDDIHPTATAHGLLGAAAHAILLPAPGDANRDGKVNVFDLAILANYYNVPGDWEWEHGDFNDDNKVNVFDLAILGNNYQPGPGGEPIPEPGALALLAIGGVALIRQNTRMDSGDHRSRPGSPSPAACAPWTRRPAPDGTNPDG